MPDSTSSSIATENSNKGLEHTAPETIDALVEEVSNKETEHDIFEIF
jgi:hypothetical protein